MISVILLNIDLSSIPFNVLSAIVAFIASYTVIKYKIKHMEDVNKKQTIDIENIKAAALENKDTYFKVREKDLKSTDEKFRHVEHRREQLKDVFTKQIHEMDKKITEIHTIIVTNYKKNG